MVKLFVFFVLSFLSIGVLAETPGEEKSHLSSPIVVFVSFSMPDASLKQWMKQAELIHAPVVIRGLIHNSFKETIQKMAALTNDNHGGVQLDPTLFRRFQIKQVPAVVVWKESDCLSNQSCVENYDVIYGDVELSFALQKISGQNDELSGIAKKALTTLREGTHE
jgi:conjugal transfer pilus assembly protein TrbC